MTDWLHINPNSGSSGTHSIAVRADANGGRSTRAAVIKIKNSSNVVKASIPVSQAANSVFVRFSSVSPLASGDTQIEVTCTSNSSSLDFSLADGTHFRLPSSVNVANANTPNDRSSVNTTPTADGVAITPSGFGGGDAYVVKLIIECPANTTLSDITDTLTATASNGSSDTLTLTHSAATSTITVNVQSLNFGADTDLTDSFTIDSNDIWSIEVADA